VALSGIRPGDRVLDICAGTGELAFALLPAVGPKGSITATDFCENIISLLFDEFLDIGGHLHQLIPTWLELDGVENRLQILSYLLVLGFYRHANPQIVFLRYYLYNIMRCAVEDHIDLKLLGWRTISQSGRLVAHDGHLCGDVP
jgi:hypothetical protein